MDDDDVDTVAPNSATAAKPKKAPDPNKPVTFLLRMMPDYKTLLETIAYKTGGDYVYLDATDREEDRLDAAGEWKVPDNLNQLLLHLSCLGLFKLWDSLEARLENERKDRAEFEAALAWIGANPGEAAVPPDLLPESYVRMHGQHRHKVLDWFASLDKRVTELQDVLAALDSHYPKQ